MRKGLLISIDGPDGSGKSTQSIRILSIIHKLGLLVNHIAEPGSTDTGDAIRRLMFEYPTTKHMSPGTVDVLLAASHNELLQSRVLPALEAGVIVISDRWFPDTNAYYSMARPETPDFVEELQQMFYAPHPDISIMLFIDPAEGLRRAQKRTDTKFDAKSWSKIESMQKVMEASRWYQSKHQDRLWINVVVDGKGEIQVTNEIWSQMSESIQDYALKLAIPEAPQLSGGTQVEIQPD